MFGEWEEVDPKFILETTLMHLSVQLSQLTDEHKSALGPATQKLRDAWPRVGLSSKALPRPPSSTGRNLRADGIPKRKPYGGGREPRREYRRMMPDAPAGFARRSEKFVRTGWFQMGYLSVASRKSV
jgi:hypothetical protein